MVNNKRWTWLAIAALVAFLLTGCGGGKDDNAAGGEPAGTEPAGTPSASAPADEDTGAAYQDGFYYAEADQFDEKSGWKYVVGLTVENGKIVDVEWTGLHKDGGIDKKTLSMQGKYGLVEKGGAQSEWHEQAEKVEQFLLDTQDPAAIQVKDDGTTDAVSGVTIKVNDFTMLVEKALAAGPTEKGPYKDGRYHAEADQFDEKSGWKDTVDVTVLGGKIFAVQWNAVHKDGGDDKLTRSRNGEYGMVANGGAQAEWHEQAARMEQFLLEKQDPAAIPVDDGGYTDAVSGVTIHVDGFLDLVQKALANAK